jgi:hypothetical protein
MRIIRDIGYVKKKKRYGRWAALIGFALLGSAFWLATTGPENVLLAYVPLLAGTLAFHFGMQQIAKWSRTPRNDQILDSQLRSLGDKYTLIHYANTGKRVIEHLLLHPGGIETFTARELAGTVAYQNGRWRKKGAGIGRFFGMGGPQLGNPGVDAQADLNAVNELLNQAQLEVETDAAIAFINPAVELDVDEPDFPVMNGDGLPEFVRSLPIDADLRPADRQALVDLLISSAAELEDMQPAPKRRPVKRRAA